MAKISTTWHSIKIRYDSQAETTWLRLEDGEEVGLKGSPPETLQRFVNRIRVEPGNRPPLPPRQAETLEVVIHHIKQHSASPSVREIALARGVTHATVFQALRALERKGFIKVSGQFRGIEVVQS